MGKGNKVFTNEGGLGGIEEGVIGTQSNSTCRWMSQSPSPLLTKDVRCVKLLA
jgi:hypothetical protein